jgi:hypothetical protein
LAERTYENKSFTFGCVVDTAVTQTPPPGLSFPSDFFERKTYQALSDGFYTAYVVSREGQLLDFLDLVTAPNHRSSRSYCPYWSTDFASQCLGNRVGIALNRQGDLLYFEQGTLRFNYRLGIWQYWNHSHLVDLLWNSIRVQNVPVGRTPRVANALYRIALDAAFRRSGGPFVILRNAGRIQHLVRAHDIMNHADRDQLHRALDSALHNPLIQTMPRPVLLELSSLDGAVVCNNKGRLLAYAAVLEPRKRGRVGPEEGSRTKAAIGASNYGLSLKISSDGDISVYVKGGTRLLRI